MSKPPPETKALAKDHVGTEEIRQFRLAVVEGADVGQSWDSRSDRFSIGSQATNDAVLKDDTVSRYHCEISLEPQGARLRDLGSRNGTIVDGTSVIDCWLRGGCLIRVGRTTLRFEYLADRTRLPASKRNRFGKIVGESVAMRSVFALLERAAKSDVTLLLEGETGTGKQGAAEAVHAASARADGPFVTIDCGGLPANLLESELFGHMRGAFTGATEDRIGAFEEADGGTVFLDEVGELPAELQPKLLRVLDQREVRAVGTNTYRPIDVRVVAATNRDLRAEVNVGQFRADLYYRLAVARVRIPPLRSRPEDLPVLVESLLLALGASESDQQRLREPAFLDGLARAAWPGNVRELRNYLHRCLVFEGMMPLAADEERRTAELAVDPRARWADERARVIAEFERAFLRSVLDLHGGSVTRAAESAGLDRVYFYKLLRKHSLSPR